MSHEMVQNNSSCEKKKLPLHKEMEKEMATHSSLLAWETPWTEEPDGLQSMGSQELDTT